MLRPFTIQILIPVRKLMKSPKIYCVQEHSRSESAIQEGGFM